MIVVLPDSKTLHNGSMYSSSVTTGDFEQFICARSGGIHRRALPHDPESAEPRTGRPLDGRLRRNAHRHEAFRCVRQLVHHEPVLLVAAAAGPPNPELAKTLEAVKTPADSASCRFLRAPRSLVPQRGHPIRRILRSISICRRRTAHRNRMSSRNGQRMRRWRSWISTSEIFASIAGSAIDVGDQDGLRVDTGKLHDVLDKYGIANSFEVYQGTHTSKVADRFQNHVLPIFQPEPLLSGKLPMTSIHEQMSFRPMHATSVVERPKEIWQQLKQPLQHNGRCRSFRPILYAVTALQGDDFPLRDNLSCFEVVSRYVRSSQWQGFLSW